MSDNLVTGLTSVVLAILGVAALAVWLNKNRTGVQFIQAGGNALAQNIEAAVSPVTGSTPSISYSSTFG